MSDAISEIVQVTITAATAVPTQKGFGVPMFVGYHNHNSDPYRIYLGTDAMLSDGFTVGEPLYLMAQAAFSQNPAPDRIMIGRLPTATARTSTITITDATAGNTATVTLTGKDGVPHVLSRTVPAASTPTAEATAWVTLINAAIGSLGASTATGAAITLTPAAVGDRLFASSVNPAQMAVVDAAAAAGYAATLGSLINANSDWYALAIADSDATNVQAVAAWSEAQPIIFMAQLSDTAELTASSVTGAALKAAAYKRTSSIWTGSPQNYAAAAWLGAVLPYKPGEATWKFKTLVGVAVDNLTPTQRSYLDANRVNHYDPIAGLNITREGYASGGQFTDLQVGMDWVSSRLKSEVFGALANAPKVPYTDRGIALLAGKARGVMSEAVDNDIVVAGSVEIRAPKAADVSTTDKGNRLLDNMKVMGQFAGAIHKTKFQVNLSL